MALAVLAAAAGAQTLDQLVPSEAPTALPGLEGRTETAVYRGSRLASGREVQTTVTITTREERMNREYHVIAEWPYGQKPLEDVLALSVRESWDEDGAAHMIAWDVLRTARAHKITGAAVEPAGTVSWELQLWRDRPVRIHLSWRDGEGSAQRSFTRTSLDFFEEELPVVLRQVDLEPGATVSFRLFPTQADGAIEPLEAVPARLTAQGDDSARVFLVEGADGREIRYTLDPEPPHALREMEHSDGRSLERLSIRWDQ